MTREARFPTAAEAPALAIQAGARVLRAAAAGLAFAALAACEPMVIQPTPTAVLTAPRPVPRAPVPEGQSADLRAYYAQVEAQRRAAGLLRTDGGGPDTPFTESMLVENFIRIALYDEYSVVGGRIVSRETPSRLRRWEQPVRMRVEFGESVPASVRTRDLREITQYAARLSRLTGHPIGLTESESAANFHVLVLGEFERREIGPRLRELIDGIDDLSVRTITDLPRGTFCLVLAFSRGGSSVYSEAVAVVRAEHPDLTRLSCYHEELAQGLGLPNDSDFVRPSVFNDQQEFALLTRHDELLLRILYDPRLRPGMREAEARPIIRRIVSELVGGEA